MRKPSKLSIFLSVGGVASVLFLKFVYEYAHYNPDEELCLEEIEWRTERQSETTTIQIYMESTNLNFSQVGGNVNDASCLNLTPVYGVVEVESQADVFNAIAFAKENELQISLAGQQHSMGGQSMIRGGLILDMKNYNQVLELNEESVSVQSGILWAELQKELDQNGLSVKAMQSINIFTVGGTISVNAHGISHNPGPIASTIKSMTIATADGKLLTASRTENSELFQHVIGGYGLFGVILDVELELVPNEVYSKTTEYFDRHDFKDWYLSNIEGNQEVGLFYARLSIVPGENFLDEVAVHIFEKTELEVSPLTTDFHGGDPFLKRLIINFSKTGRVGKYLRWTLEKNYHPQACLTRNEAMSQSDEVCDVTRNTATYDSMEYLKNNLSDTDILQEYFVPFDQFDAFVDELRDTVEAEDVNLLNVTIRIVHKDEISAIPYAKEDMFTFVLYFNHQLTEEDQDKLTLLTNRLIEVATDLNGSFYLPYQLVYSKEALNKAYPTIKDFAATKNMYDKNTLFSNQWWEKYFAN